MADPPLFLGFDRSSYPGSSLMQGLYEFTNLSFCGVYLAPAPRHPDTGWMSQPAEGAPAGMTIPEILRAQGWGLAPVLVGLQATDGNGDLTAAGGSADAQAALGLAQQAGFDGGVIYLDIEDSGTPQPDPAMTAYAIAWLNGVAAANYTPGMYAHRPYIDLIVPQVPEAVSWVVRFAAGAAPQFDDTGAIVAPGNPTDVGGSSAIVWQYVEDWAGPLTFSDETGTQQQLPGKIDFDVATAPDPNLPITGPAAKTYRSVTSAQADAGAIVGGDSTTLTLTIDGNAPWPNGALIRLAASPSGGPGDDPVALPSSVRVAAGNATVAVSVSANTVSSDVAVTITSQCLFQTAPVTTQVTVQAAGG